MNYEDPTPSRKPDFSEKEEKKIWLSEQKSLRKLVGILGMLLPLLLYVYLYIVTGHCCTLESVSHYYFTRAGSIFTIVLSLLAIFLMIYKGKAKLDFILSTAAGVFALCVILFPTTNVKPEICCDDNNKYIITVLEISRGVRSTFHYVAAAIFLGCLAFMSIFIFTKSDKPRSLQTPKKKIRNVIYVVCGILMLLALLVAFAGYKDWIDPDFYNSHHLTFWMETIAVESFGFSWLVKGEFILEDK
ncbi:MAG: hypothetical protein QM737_19815 [Ferruginibacter sp.]